MKYTLNILLETDLLETESNPSLLKVENDIKNLLLKYIEQHNLSIEIIKTKIENGDISNKMYQVCNNLEIFGSNSKHF